mmetsp:Transcript_1300/g.1979  ORF Transcript_1300/g.1979 Transcript_1300/m.1979 type:complete len:445 (+) Transcript_1300:156-1490(+)
MSATQEVGPIFGEGEGPAQAMLRSPTVIIASIGLWGMDLFFYRRFKLDYVSVLNLDLVKEREAQGIKQQQTPTPNQNRITAFKCIMLSLFLQLLLHLSEYVYQNIYGGSAIGATFFFYILFTLAITFPLTTTRWIRIATMLVLERCWALVNPRCSCIIMPANGPRPIPFIDVFYADAMCSLSKVFFDWGMLLHMAIHYPDPVPKALDSILVPSAFAAVPYIIRARQCLIMYTVGRLRKDPKRYQHILNAIKYSTSLFPICFSAYQQTLSKEAADSLENALILLLVINASYSLTWDIVMDWGMFQDPAAVARYAFNMESPLASSPSRAPKQCSHVCMRPKLRFGGFASAGIIIADTILRFAWLLRFVEGSFFPSKEHFILVTELLEAFRRSIWNLLRVEWENIKHMRSKQDELGIEGDSNDEEDEIAPFFQTPPSLELASRSNRE